MACISVSHLWQHGVYIGTSDVATWCVYLCVICGDMMCIPVRQMWQHGVYIFTLHMATWYYTCTSHRNILYKPAYHMWQHVEHTCMSSVARWCVYLCVISCSMVRKSVRHMWQDGVHSLYVMCGTCFL